MADDFQQDGAQAPEVAIQSAGAEIAQMTGGPGGGSKGGIVGAAQDAMADAIISSFAGPLKYAVALADGLGGKNNNQKGAAASHFVGGGAQQRRPTPTPLVPMGYAAMKAAAKRAAKFGVKSAVRGAGIFATERLALVSQSVTGGGTADGQKKPLKGAKLAKGAVERLSQLTKSLSAALHAKEGVNRYDGSSARLGKDLNNDSKLAKKVVTVNPGIRPPALSNSSAAS